MEQQAIIIGNYLQLEQIGQGSYGSVYKFRNLMDNQEYAGKKFDKTITMKKTLRTEFENLLKCMKYENENIVKFIELIQTKEHYIMVLEKCDGDLLKIIEQGMSEKVALNYFKQIVNGIQLLHKIKISHRDLKPGNILIKGNTIKIADLGLGCLQEMSGLLHCSRQIGTIGYMAPEVIHMLDHNPKVADMYSLGIIFLQLIYGKNASIELQNNERYGQISSEINNLIKKMIKENPDERLKWSELTQFLENSFGNYGIQNNNSSFYIVEREEKVNFFLELYEKLFKLNHGDKINPFTPAYMILKVVYLELKQRERELNDIQNQKQPQQLEELIMRIDSIKTSYDIYYRENKRIKFEREFRGIMEEELNNQYSLTDNFNKNLKFILKVYFQQLKYINQKVNSPQLILEVKCSTLIAINYGFTKLQDLIYGELKNNNQQVILKEMVDMAQNGEINLEEIERNLN